MFCAVNFRYWRYAVTKEEAIKQLAIATTGKPEYTDEDKKKYLFRLYEMPERADGWNFYCPEFRKGIVFTILEDNMKDWKDGELPCRLRTTGESLRYERVGAK